MTDKFMVFDVESIGLHGEGFAVAWVVEATSPTPQHLRNTFWHEWRHWADQGAVLVADCAWPCSRWAAMRWP